MTVFANGLEISAKAQGCKIIAAFPDTCFTPPQAPPTPPGVPIPYPNFATDSDVSKGTGTVKISEKEVSQENSSNWSKVSGDEAGAAPKKGIITSKNTGKAYAQKWSMNVKAEGKGVVRFSDLATTNHQSNAGNDAPWLIVAKASPSWTGTCDAEDFNFSVYRPNSCPEGQTPHHIIDNSSFTRPNARTTARKSDYAEAADMDAGDWKKLNNLFQADSAHPGKEYNEVRAPCICVQGARKKGTEHYAVHQEMSKQRRKYQKTKSKAGLDRRKWTYKEAKAAAIESCKKGCDPKLTEQQSECLKIVLEAYFEKGDPCSMQDDTEIRCPDLKVVKDGQTFNDGAGNMCAMSPAPV